MKNYLFDDSEKRARMVRICEMRLCEAFDGYCMCLGESHKTKYQEKSKEYYDEAVWRWQDLQALRYDKTDDWDLNYEDYDEEIEDDFLIKNNRADDNGWIDIKDTLPPDHGDEFDAYLVRTSLPTRSNPSGGMYTAVYTKGKFIIFGNEHLVDKITHWTKLPEPPKMV